MRARTLQTSNFVLLMLLNNYYVVKRGVKYIHLFLLASFLT